MVRVAVIDDYHRAFAGTDAIGRLRELANIAIYDKSFSSQDVMRTSDIVSIRLPLSDLSRGLVSRERIGLMKPTACLVNTARAAITDELALIDALASRRIAGAALDVFMEEPLPGLRYASSTTSSCPHTQVGPRTGRMTHG